MWEGLYFYGFGEDGERGEGYFPSIEEALEHARKNTDEDDTVNIGQFVSGAGRCLSFA